MSSEHTNRILVVDDDREQREIVHDILKMQGYTMMLAASGAEALRVVPVFEPDVILLDITMPGMDGFEVCKRLRAAPETAEVPIIMVTALDDRDTRLRGIALGADEFLTKPLDFTELRIRVQALLKVNRYRLLMEERQRAELHAQMLAEQAQHAAAVLANAYDTTLEGWVRALDLRDKETEGHSQRVTDLTLQLSHALGLGLDEETLVHLRRGALLHDIGKLGVPDAILHKPGPLTPEEWQVMRQHPVYAYELLWPIPFLRPALDIPYCHHEKWDGSGYPRGLRGDDIPLSARIFALVDVWDALTSDRVYRSAWSPEQAASYMRAEAGRHFDPALTEQVLELVLGA